MELIIQIRGTSGSGKSTVMREVMEHFGKWKPWYIDGKKKPLSYNYETKTHDLTVLGHYESQCGGCDTIGSARQVYDVIQETDADVILCEGLLLSEDTKWSSQLKDLRVVYLITPIETCLKRIQERRNRAGNDKPLNTKNTINRVRVIERSRLKLDGLGIKCTRASSKQASGVVLKWIKNNHG